MADRSIFTHRLNILRGSLPANMGRLDASAKLSANVDPDDIPIIYAGRVMHLNSDEEFEMGCTGKQMAYFNLVSSDASDVATDQAADDKSKRVFPRGKLTALPAIGNYELEITSGEYDPAQTYVIDQLLRAVASNSDATTGGRLTNQSLTMYTNAACAIVRKPKYTNINGVECIAIYTIYLPGSGA